MESPLDSSYLKVETRIHDQKKWLAGTLSIGGSGEGTRPSCIIPLTGWHPRLENPGFAAVKISWP